MKRLLGSDKEITKFDALRYKLKKAKKAGPNPQLSTTYIKLYKELAVKLGDRVRFTQSRLNQELKEMEHKHYAEHGTLPPKVTGSLYSSIISKRNLATTILRNIITT